MTEIQSVGVANRAGGKDNKGTENLEGRDTERKGEDRKQENSNMYQRYRWYEVTHNGFEFCKVHISASKPLFVLFQICFYLFIMLFKI